MAESPLHKDCNGPLVTLVWAQPDRWQGPANARLFCPACGDGIVGTDAEVEQAVAADAAYERGEMLP